VENSPHFPRRDNWRLVQYNHQNSPFYQYFNFHIPFSIIKIAIAIMFFVSFYSENSFLRLCQLQRTTFKAAIPTLKLLLFCSFVTIVCVSDLVVYEYFNLFLCWNTYMGVSRDIFIVLAIYNRNILQVVCTVK